MMIGKATCHWEREITQACCQSRYEQIWAHVLHIESYHIQVKRGGNPQIDENYKVHKMSADFDQVFQTSCQMMLFNFYTLLNQRWLVVSIISIGCLIIVASSFTLNRCKCNLWGIKCFVFHFFMQDFGIKFSNELLLMVYFCDNIYGFSGFVKPL